MSRQSNHVPESQATLGDRKLVADVSFCDDLLGTLQIFIRGGVPQGHDDLLCKSQIFIRGGVPQGHDNLPCDFSRGL